MFCEAGGADVRLTDYFSLFLSNWCMAEVHSEDVPFVVKTLIDYGQSDKASPGQCRSAYYIAAELLEEYAQGIPNERELAEEEQ